MQSFEIFIIFLGIIVVEFVVNTFISYLNTTYWSLSVPKELQGIYDQSKYSISQKYEKQKHVFHFLHSIFSFFCIFIALAFGFFGFLDTLLRQFTQNSFTLSLLFFLVIFSLQSILQIPFDYYETFVIEQRYGFNKSSKKLFFGDFLKSFIVTIFIGGFLLTFILWAYNKTGDYFWFYAWGIVSIFSIVMMMFYSQIIVPLFNKQTPLQDGELKTAIQNFAKKVGFQLDNIYVMDGSKRSSKANAYFTGLWKKKRIVLFDTLIAEMSIEEIVAVLAHEIGHYKKKHTLQMLIFSIFQTGFVFYILSLTLGVPEISYALGASTQSFHIGVIAFAILFTPISMILGIFVNMLSRKNEYEADEFASVNYSAKKLQNALKKLTVNNLTNLRPHPVYEFVHYSHPTVLKRLQVMEKFTS